MALTTILVAANVAVLVHAWRLGGAGWLLGLGLICGGLTLHVLAGGER